MSTPKRPPPDEPTHTEPAWVREGREWVEKINAEFAVVMMGGDCCLLREVPSITPDHPPDIHFVDDASFRRYLKPYGIWTESAKGNKVRIPVTDWWERSTDRRQYEGLTFDPHPPDDDRRYNLWKGFAILADPSTSCHLFTNHLRDVVCAGRLDDFAWLLSWLAQLIQRPHIKPGTSVVLRGAQGSGKTMVGYFMGKLLGPHYIATDNPRYLTGRFNSHLARCLLLQLEEATWGGDHTAAGQLKGLITAPTQMIEYKGKEPVELPSYVRVLITTNAAWVVPAGLDDRRFAVFELAEHHVGDVPYFQAIFDQMERDGGLGNLLAFLEHYPINDAILRHPPRTLGLYGQALQTLPPLDQWWMDRLNDGQLPGDRASEGVVSKRGLYEHYLASMKERGIARSLSDKAFGWRLRELCPGLLGSSREAGGDRRMLYQLPPLPACRNIVSAKWPGIVIWQDKERAWESSARRDPPNGSKNYDGVSLYE